MVTFVPPQSSIFSNLTNISYDDPDAISLELALKVLELGNFEEKWAIAKILVKYGKEVIAPLKEVILDEKANVEHRWYSLKILNEIKNPEIILIVTELLNITQEEDLLLLASQTLASQGKQSIAFLSQLLENSSYRRLAMKALSQIPSIEIVKPLLSVVNDQDSTIRAMAIATLRNFDTPEIKSVMINALKDYASSVRKEAVIGLGLKLKLSKELEIVKLMLPLLYDINLSVAQQTVISLSRCSHPLVTRNIYQLLRYSNTPDSLKITVVRSLSWIATPKSLECLEEYIYISNLSITIEIITVLGRVTKSDLQSQAVTILSNFYHSNSLKLKSPEILQCLCYSLKQLNATTTIDIVKAIEANDNSQVRFYAQNALKQLEIE